MIYLNILRYSLILILLSLILNSKTYAEYVGSNNFFIDYQSLKGNVKKNVESYTWNEKCPVDLSNLILLKLSYWGFDEKPHIGEIIVHRKAAPEIILIFSYLYDLKYPISSMKPMYNYFGNDNQSMLDNNTVAFNCRLRTGYKNKFSKHSYGISIDINPLLNPYIKNGIVLPRKSNIYIERNPNVKGLITKDSSVYKVFDRFGWKWGGSWRTLKDYQHFEKDIENFKSQKKYFLKINKLPKNSSIKIMNIHPSYNEGRIFNKGIYKIRINLNNNNFYDFWVIIEEDTTIDFQEIYSK